MNIKFCMQIWTLNVNLTMIPYTITNILKNNLIYGKIYHRTVYFAISIFNLPLTLSNQSRFTPNYFTLFMAFHTKNHLLPIISFSSCGCTNSQISRNLIILILSILAFFSIFHVLWFLDIEVIYFSVKYMNLWKVNRIILIQSGVKPVPLEVVIIPKHHLI